MKLRSAHFLILCLLVAGCAPAQSGSGSPQAWIDAPLDGSVLPLAPYEIIVHGAAPAAPAGMEITINGQAVNVAPNSSGSRLQVARYTWSPTAPGRYVIAVRTLDSSQQWSSPHTHVVTVAGEIITVTPGITVTPVITVTVSVTPTITPTITATPVTPPPAGPASINFLGASTDQFYWGTRSCGPTEVSLQVQVSDPAQIRGVLLFVKLRNKDTGAYTDWNEGTQMRAAGNGKFTLAFQSASLPQPSGNQNWLIYQFVGTGADNQSVTRTQVYSDITLTMCGRGIIPVP
jgi:hypothetical protein